MSNEEKVFDGEWHLKIDRRVTTLEECIKNTLPSVKKNQAYMFLMIALGFLGTIAAIVLKGS